jgi:hypothetical protein
MLALVIARARFGFLATARDAFFVLLALVFAPLLTMNQQILTGKIMQTGHYHWYFDRPVALITAAMIAFYVLGYYGSRKVCIAAATLAIAGSLAVGVFVQTYTYAHGPRYGGPAALALQAYGPVMDWLNGHAAPDQVVLAGDEISDLVTIYTPLDVVYHHSAMYMLAATEERLRDALFIFYRLRGVGEGDAREVLYTEREDISGNLYGVHYRDARGAYDAIPQDVLDGIIAAYEATLATPTDAWLANMFERYKVEYVIWDMAKDPSWQLDRYAFLHKEATFGRVAIYTVVR